MTKMAAMPRYGKIPSKSSQELVSNFPQNLICSFRDSVCSNDDLDLFYGMVKFGNLGYSIGKSENSGFFRNYCSLCMGQVPAIASPSHQPPSAPSDQR